MAILRAAIYSQDQNYQPSESALHMANDLYVRGLLTQREDFPAVTVATDAGRDAYQAELEAQEAEHGEA